MKGRWKNGRKARRTDRRTKGWLKAEKQGKKKKNRNRRGKMKEGKMNTCCSSGLSAL